MVVGRVQRRWGCDDFGVKERRRMCVRDCMYARMRAKQTRNEKKEEKTRRSARRRVSKGKGGNGMGKDRLW